MKTLPAEKFRHTSHSKLSELLSAFEDYDTVPSPSDWIKDDVPSQGGQQPFFFRFHLPVEPESQGNLHDETVEAVSQFQCTETELEQRFNDFVEKWHKDTFLEASITAALTHPAYYGIIGLGERVIPLILHELEQRPDHWFVALTALTQEDPSNPGDGFDAAVQAWLQWGRERNLLK